MRVRLVAKTLAVAGLFAGSQLPTPAEPLQQAEAIDFDALRAQAQAALTAAAVARSARSIGRIHRVLMCLHPGRKATAPLVWSVSRSTDVW